ncbi:hypothetical protein NFI96_000424 [Prochilodus magdalenae]|nr:hypothetical protein NFI96_000424 [Prochilodus magdalenae]
MNSTLPYSLSLELSITSALVTSIIVLNFLLGLPLNVYIIVLLFPRCGVMEASDVFSWNQAVSEIFYVLSGPFHILCSLSFSLCIVEALGFFLGTSLFSRCLFQSCVCLERYLAVVHPVTFLRYKPLRYRVGCSISVWMCSLAIAVTYSCMFLHFPYKVFAVVYVIILIIDGFFCVSILRKLRDPGPRDMERDTGEMDATKKRAFQDLNMNSTLTYSLSLDLSVIPALVLSIHLLNFLLGLPLNVYIIVLLFPRRGVMEASDVFSWNQAVSEILYVLSGPFHILCNVSYSLCIVEALGFFIGTSFASRCLFQSCMCLEWYLAVVHPVTFLRYKPLRYRVGCSVTVWMCSLAIGVTYSSMLRNLPYTVFAVGYAGVLMVDGFCCVSILRRLRDPGPRDMERDAGEMDAAKKKAFQVVSVNLLAFLLQNVTVSVVYGFQDALSPYIIDVVSVFGMVSSVVTGLFQSVYTLYRTGKLPLAQSTSFTGCCCSSGRG